LPIYLSRSRNEPEHKEKVPRRASEKDGESLQLAAQLNHRVKERAVEQKGVAEHERGGHAGGGEEEEEAGEEEWGEEEESGGQQADGGERFG